MAVKDDAGHDDCQRRLYVYRSYSFKPKIHLSGIVEWCGRVHSKIQLDKDICCYFRQTESNLH